MENRSEITEEKGLLLHDLSARLPYGIIAQYHGTGGLIKGYEEAVFNIIVDAIDVNKQSINYRPYEDGYEPCSNVSGARIFNDRKNIVYMKPYLRPMSSMTEEEKEEWEWMNPIPDGCYPIEERLEMFDWLNAHHFDYRDLIPKGLAIEAPKGMYTDKM